MATRFLMLAAASALLLLVSLSPTPTTGQTVDDAVLDLSGNPVEYGAEYYIIPVGGRLGGGLTRSSKPHQPRCPLYLVQSPDPNSKGTAVKFVPVGQDTTQTVVRAGEDLRINSGPGGCLSRGFWKVLRDGPTGREEIIASGERRIPPANFRLARWSVTSPLPVYQIIHCLNCGNPDKVGVVGPLSVVDDSNANMKIIAFSPGPNDVSHELHVVFVKKTEETPLNIEQVVFNLLE